MRQLRHFLFPIIVLGAAAPAHARAVARRPASPPELRGVLKSLVGKLVTVESPTSVKEYFHDVRLVEVGVDVAVMRKERMTYYIPFSSISYVRVLASGEEAASMGEIWIR